ncbi:MAG: flagellar biosynthetic protein FliO [Thermodesulfobacteria bacterium]|nr:flagellar biosynthetic protein FliO [Thermodesulfobacteriota bacterium]
MEWLSYLQAIGILLLLLSLLPIGAYLYKKFYQKKPVKSRIKVLEVKPVSYKAQLLLIEVEGKRLLLGLSDKGLTYLTELKAGEGEEEDVSCDSSSDG